ncbi:hypothetical protein FVD63_14585, partial [Enterococcus faecium]|nr:hypothetical protein [Enterococcus faecium]
MIFYEEVTVIAEEPEPLVDSRVGISKRKLVRFQNELNEQFDNMFEHQRNTIGQPMNEMINTHYW